MEAKALELLKDGQYVIIFLFFMPGFIMQKSYLMLYPSRDKDFSKKIFESLIYSCVYFAMIVVPVVLGIESWMIDECPSTISLVMLLVGIVIPFGLPHLYVKVSRIKFVRSTIMAPFERPWEQFFSRKQPCWVIIHLKNKTKIGGEFSTSSFASSSLDKDQVYLEKLWEVDSDGYFIKPIDRTAGAIFNKDDWDFIEFRR